MATNHDAVAALPISGAPSKTLLRNTIVARMPYVLADADDVTDLIAIDPDTGATIIDITFLGRLFHYDPTDTTTASDGISCLVTSDGLRYKLGDGSDVFAYSVLDNTIATPPVSPTIGDAYLIASGATGAWSGKANYIGVFTRRGWEFINYGIGRFVYVESVESYYHKNSLGTWVVGLGSNSYQASSIPITAVIGAKASFVVKVENQTTNAPPASPVSPTAYIIGPSPTGSWAGNATKLAMCLVDGTFTIITPTAGDAVYDKTTQNSYRFNGTAWISSAGAWLTFHSTGLKAARSSVSGSINYSYDATTAPTQGSTARIPGDSLTYTALSATSKLRFVVCMAFVANANANSTVAIYRDSESNAIAWAPMRVETTLRSDYSRTFVITSGDISAHTYQVAFVQSVGATYSMQDTYFSIEESA